MRVSDADATQSGRPDERARAATARKPWHTPQFMMSNINATNTGTLSHYDPLPGSSS